MPQGLPRKIRIVFILQVVTVSLALVLGGWVVSAIIKHSFVQKASQAEAEEFFRMRVADPTHPVPQARNFAGWFVPAGVGTEGVPREVASLPPGYHELRDSDRLVRVERQPAGTLYLAYDRERVDDLLYNFAVLPIASALVAILLVSWLTYRASRRLVVPVNWLAREVARWDPMRPDYHGLAPENLPPDIGGGEARQLARALHVLGRRVETFVARERDFTRDASHELRTPLTVIRVGADLLQVEPALSPRGRRSLERIQRAARDMEAVIDAFLILAREAEIEPLSDDFDVRDVVDEEVDKVRSQLIGKPVQLRVEANASPKLHAPPRVLGVMLGNLLSNACMFTDAGEIEVRLEADRVSVRDTGVGMDAAELERAFDPFFRSDDAREGAGAKPRMGIGLSIVRRLGERFGWPVSLQSTPGEGTTATIQFA